MAVRKADMAETIRVEHLRVGYDREADFLEVFFEKGTSDLGEEVLPGVTLFRAVSDQRLVGFAIMGLRRRSSRPGWLTIPLESTLPEVTLDELEAEWRAMPAQRSDQDEESPLRRAVIPEKTRRDVEPLPVGSE
jgi:hypothetical protein